VVQADEQQPDVALDKRLVPPLSPRQHLITAELPLADKTIKLWKVHEKKVKSVANLNLDDTQRSNPSTTVSSLKIPQVNTSETIVTATPRRVYSSAHAYHINSISMNSDGETFLSADDLRINLWNMGITDKAFSESTHTRVLLPIPFAYASSFSRYC
jgi:serine/threonine-protein phosphatase 2A regulatory subunit B